MLAISDCCSSDLHIEDDGTLDVVGEKHGNYENLEIFHQEGEDWVLQTVNMRMIRAALVFMAMGQI